MQTLLIDNYDSFTFNIFQLLARVTGVKPLVVRNDELSWSALADLDVDAIVISPGPGRADRARDFGVSTQAVRQFPGAVLGICLGHQGICHLFGGSFDYAETVMHGRVSRIRHAGSDLFSGIPQGFEAVRYHSLVAVSTGDVLEATAWSDDGHIMGIRHRERPMWGVQFHPESIATQYGPALLENFCELARRTPHASRKRIGKRPALPEPEPGRSAAAPTVPPLRLFTRRLRDVPGPEECFTRLFASAPDAYWLDSSAPDRDTARFSFMGDASGPLAERIRYDVQRAELVRATAHDVTTSSGRVFDALATWLDERRIAPPEGVPFPFVGGWVGYLGYELKADCGAAVGAVADRPDAQLIFADRVVAFDHASDEAWLLCLDRADEHERAEEWFARVTLALEAPNRPVSPPAEPDPVTFYPRYGDAEYERLIEAAKAAIRQGETYEVCLTNEYVATCTVDAFEAYRRLRRSNAAPYGAFLRFEDLAVLASSPECFLRIDAAGGVESRPIKGTIRRGRDAGEDVAYRESLRTSIKDRSENLMIVDLIRNDLGSVCEIGSVHVPVLFGIESFASVHQMVSTVRGQLAPLRSPIDCVRAAFPGGSMTGAPKLRTMEIIDLLERRARGVYSGAIGYISVTGAVDLNVVIRTAVVDGRSVRIGAGGAIVDLSDPAAELAEVRLKCAAVMAAYGGIMASA